MTNPITYLSSPINLKISLPTSLVHTFPGIYYPFHQTDDTKVPLILLTLPYFSAFGTAFLAFFHCYRKSLFLPRMCWQQENSLRLKNLKMLGLWPDAWELTSQLPFFFFFFLHQPHRSWAVPALTPVQTASPSLVLPPAIAETSLSGWKQPHVLKGHTFLPFWFFFCSLFFCKSLLFLFFKGFFVVLGFCFCNICFLSYF